MSDVINRLTKVRRPRILVVGDVMLDRYISGSSSRISPEAPVPVVAAERDDLRPGGAANVACNVQALGAECTLIGLIGLDAAGRDLAEVVQSYGVNCRFILQASERTTEKTRVIAGAQQITRIDRDGRVTSERRDELFKLFAQNFKEYDGVIFSDYDKGALERLPEMIDMCRVAGIPTLVDPKCADPARYRNAFLIKPNAKEFKELLGPYDDMVAHAKSALAAQGWQHLVVTLSGDGILLVSADGSVKRLATKAKEVFDVSGAGDTVISAIAVSLLSGDAIETAIAEGNLAASIAVARAGTGVISRADVEAHRSSSFRHDKYLPIDKLVRVLAAEKAQNRTIVFTNGCFDIIHSGHVKVLTEARAMGDLLVVGLNSDESITHLKGPTRPVNSLDDRATVISALGCVDFVVTFNEDTPLKLIEAISPDVLVKGGDYDIEAMIGADHVIANGGKVEIVELLEGRSTTEIIKRAHRFFE